MYIVVNGIANAHRQNKAGARFRCVTARGLCLRVACSEAVSGVECGPPVLQVHGPSQNPATDPTHPHCRPRQLRYALATDERRLCPHSQLTS